jgi:hypothetical protein
MSKNKFKKNVLTVEFPINPPLPLTLHKFKKGGFAQVLSKYPNCVKEIVNSDGILGIVAGEEIDLPTNANEFSLEINFRTPTVKITVDYFLNELSQKHSARIFSVAPGTTYIITTDLSWNEVTKLFQQSMSVFGLWPFN